MRTRARLLPTLVAAVVGAVGVVGATAAPALAATHTPSSVTGHGTGSGATQSAATFAARTAINSDYFGCAPATFFVVSATLESDGLWYVTATETCQGFR